MKKYKNILLLLAFLVLLVAVVSLLKKSGPEQVEIPGGVITGKRLVKPLQIDEVILEPKEPLSTSIIRIEPRLNQRVDRGEVTFVYRWFINGEELLNVNSNILPEQYRIKNYEGYCIVKGVRGKYETKEKKSPKFKIANSPPIIRHQPVEPFDVPGDFYHKISAYDPDGDTLTYELLAPLGMNVRLDGQTGEIRWKIPGVPKIDVEVHKEDDDLSETVRVPDKTNPRVTIVVRVSDTEGAKKIVSVKLDLSQGKEVPF